MTVYAIKFARMFFYSMITMALYGGSAAVSIALVAWAYKVITSLF